MYKIFELVQLIDGGPNDKGSVVGYIKAASKNEANSKCTNVFMEARLITHSEYMTRKNECLKALAMFKF